MLTLVDNTIKFKLRVKLYFPAQKPVYSHVSDIDCRSSAGPEHEISISRELLETNGVVPGKENGKKIIATPRDSEGNIGDPCFSKIFWIEEQ